MKAIKIVETMASAASALNISVAEVRRAKRAACPAFRPGGRIHLKNLSAWLKAHPRQKVADHPLGTLPQDVGAASALRRLEQEERKAYAALQAALGADTEAEARSWWLRTSEQLRRHDLAVEASRRDAGDLLPRAECERVIAAVVATMAIHWRGAIESVCPDLAASTDREPRAMLARLSPVAAGAMAETLAALRTRPWAGAMLPSWALSAMERAIEGHG